MKKLCGRTIGERIRFLRVSRGMTQMDLANKFKLAHGGVVSMYEQGKRQLSPELVVAYSKTFDVSTDWILKGEEA